jgi:transcriptional regulator with XRE-family HTH domain
MLPLPARLAALRNLSGLTASELGTLAGFSTAIVSLIENGKRSNPQHDTLEGLARVLGDESGYLQTGRGEPPAKEVVLAAVAKARGPQAEPTGKVA